MPTQTGEIALVKLDQIKVVPENNPRGIVTRDDVVELAASVSENGVVEPVICVEGPDGLELVAGYRRHMAAEVAEEAEIPVYVRDAENRDVDALTENLPGLREDMSPMAEGRAMKIVMSSKGLNQKKLAKRLGKSSAFVAERMRMVRLPQAVQEVFASGRPGIATVPAIEKIANVSEPAAVRIAQIASEDSRSEQALRQRPEQILHTLEGVLEEERGTLTIKGDGEDGDHEVPRPPAEGELVVLNLFSHNGIDLYALALTDERRGALAGRFEALENVDGRIQTDGENYAFGLDETDIDGLRALGVLLEYEDEERWYEAAYCFDSEAVADRLEQLLDAAEGEASKRVEATQKEAEEAAKKKGKDLPADADPAAVLKAEEDETKAAERKREKKDKEKKRKLNLDLGFNLIKRRARKRSAKRRRELIRGLALLAIDAEEHLAGLGPRLVYAAWQEVENKELKKGGAKEIVTYLEPSEATERLRKRVIEAKTEDEILDEIGDALVAAIYADEEELAMTRRVCGYSGGLRHGRSGPVRRAIDTEAQGVLPEPRRKELERSQKLGYDEKEAWRRI